MKSGILFRPPRTRRAIRIVAFIARRIGAALCGRPCLLRRYLIKDWCFAKWSPLALK